MDSCGNYEAVRERVANAARRAGSEVALLAVSKTRPAAEVRALAARGQRAFGENYVQEGMAKRRELADLDLQWHAIGPLQSNKAREVAAHFDWLQSLDRVRLVGALDRLRPPGAAPLQVLIQVNIDDEASKSGCAPKEIGALAEAVDAAANLTLRGLMAIPAPDPDPRRREAAFARMRRLYEELRRSRPGVDTLSMGMSEDFEAAIANGATMVRVGTALFGARIKKTRGPARTPGVAFATAIPSSSTQPHPMSTESRTRIAFVGGGNMARSLIGGLARAGVPGSRIAVAEPNADLRAALARDFGIAAHADGADAAREADAIVLAVKPQAMKAVCLPLREIAQARRPVIVSIAAGIRIGQIETWLGGDLAIVRAMPNTPALIGCGAAALVANARADTAQRELARGILDAAGLAVWIGDEALMDTVTALSGSGPAYFFLLAEALEDAAVAQGLPRETARALAAQTCLGAGRMLRENGEAPPALRARVTSPNGTTQAAVESFEADGLRTLVARAVAAATRRGQELSAQTDQ